MSPYLSRRPFAGSPRSLFSAHCQGCFGQDYSLSRATETLSESLVLPPDSTSSSHESCYESLSFSGCRPCADLTPADAAWTVPISSISASGARQKQRTCSSRLCLQQPCQALISNELSENLEDKQLIQHDFRVLELHQLLPKDQSPLYCPVQYSSSTADACHDLRPED
jgi:hypothetical protein